MRTRQALFRMFCLLIIALFYGQLPAVAAVPTNLEVEFTEASLLLRMGRPAASLELLNRLLQKSPGQAEFLELKALAHQKNKDPELAAECYRQLINLNTNPNPAPYYFELGVIEYGLGHWDSARTALEAARAGKHQTGLATFLIGNCALQNHEIGKAQQIFQELQKGSDLVLSIRAKHMLGLIELELRNRGQMIKVLQETKKDAERALSKPLDERDQKTLQGLITEIDQSLGKLKKSSFFGNLSNQTGYDSNVLLVPSTSTDATLSNKSSLKTSFGSFLGFATAPWAEHQLVVSHRMSFPYHSNSATRKGEFFPQTGTLTWSRRPLALKSFGASYEFNFTLQNQVKTNTRRFAYDRYLDSHTLDLFYRFRPTSEWETKFDASTAKQHYWTDETTETNLQRSGYHFSVKGQATRFRPGTTINPTFETQLGWNLCKGVKDKAFDGSLSASNSFEGFGKNKLTPSASVGYTWYYRLQSAKKRKDWLLTPGLRWENDLTSKIQISADFQYNANFSNFDNDYSYKRYTLLGGITYSL